jgi:FXSXX-COOH protein
MGETGTERGERVPHGPPRVDREPIAVLLASPASALAHAVVRVRDEALRSTNNYAAFGNSP